MITHREQRDLALRALRRIGISLAEIAEACETPISQVDYACKGIQTRPLRCCVKTIESDTRVIGRQYGHHAEEDAGMPQ